MNVSLNVSALQAYLSQDQTIQMLAGLVHNALNQSPLYSVLFEITALNPGTNPPSISLLDVEDIEVDLGQQLLLHDIVIPGLQPFAFDAPVQGILEIQCESNCEISFTATLSYDQIAPRAIRFPISGRISDVVLQGRLSVRFAGDALVFFFAVPPLYQFELTLQVGGEEKLIDDHHVRDLLAEVIDDWLMKNLLDGNAVRIPFESKK
jgi:hypothetical protein